MALIAMATYCTPENKKASIFSRTLQSITKQLSFEKHRLVIVDNSPGDLALEQFNLFPEEYQDITFISNRGENVGTAAAINQAWKTRGSDDIYAIKMDDDVIIHDDNWIDQMEEAMNRDQTIGILGLKRKDLDENPYAADPNMRSMVRMLRGEKGQRWIIVEDVQHVMGTCQMYSPELLRRIGYLVQPRKYGFDDSLAAIRCKMAGMRNSFLPHIEIDHIDPGGNQYTEDKLRMADEDMPEYRRLYNGYKSGEIDIYYNPFKEKIPA